MRILITGSLGLVGSEATRYYLDKGHEVIGVDNNMRKHFFGEDGCGLKNMIKHENYNHVGEDISKCEPAVMMQPDAVIHCAGQPSHDWAKTNPILDFGVNAYSTLMLLEMCRKHCPDTTFVFLSTNKVYGDNPNSLPFEEKETRYDTYCEGVDEFMPVDQCMHSLFGVSKLSADLAVQEYGKYFGMKTVCFRCGCVTGSRHAGVELHGFLSYMVKCKQEGRRYKIYGYKGKQVRDNIHAFDLVTAIDNFLANPRKGEVYNMGGSRHSNVSVLESLKRLDLEYDYIPVPRSGDHKWYISDVSKFKNHYPEWEYKYSIDDIFDDLTKGEKI